MSVPKELRVGIFGIGLDTYWDQFAGLKMRLEGYIREVAERLARPGISFVNLGLVDSPKKALEAGHAFRQADVDLLLLYVTTYALSSTVLPVVRRAGVPVIVLNLQPERAIQYDEFNRLGDRTHMTGKWLAYCSACPVPEIANVFRRARIPFHQVTGTLDHDPQAWKEIEEWLKAAQVAWTLSHSRLGLMGHYYGGMLDIATDLALVSGVFGTHIEFLEVDQLSAIRTSVSNAEIEAEVGEFRREFDVRSDCSEEELRRAARTSVALRQLAAEHELNLMAYYYMGAGNQENADAMSSIILGTSLLTARGVPVAGEYEVKNALAMKILDTLGAGGSFTEYYAIDFAADRVLMGHDGPGHIAIAQGKPRVRPLEVYHGKVGQGLSIEMSVKHGPVTLLSVAEDAETGFKLVVAEGESVPGPILEIGNTNSQYQFPIGARHFVDAWNEQGPAHHCAVGVGHIASTLRKLAGLLSLKIIQVC